MSKLTGDKNLDIDIINRLSDTELGTVCKVNKYVRSLCNDNILWRKRIALRYKIPSEESLEMY
jgi:hypothetical protein